MGCWVQVLRRDVRVSENMVKIMRENKVQLNIYLKKRLKMKIKTTAVIIIRENMEKNTFVAQKVPLSHFVLFHLKREKTQISNISVFVSILINQ